MALPQKSDFNSYHSASQGFSKASKRIKLYIVKRRREDGGKQFLLIHNSFTLLTHIFLNSLPIREVIFFSNVLQELWVREYWKWLNIPWRGREIEMFAINLWHCGHVWIWLKGDVSNDAALLPSTSLICQWYNLLLIDFIGAVGVEATPNAVQCFITRYLYLLLTDSKMEKNPLSS